MDESVILERDAAVVRIVLNRPEAMNAIGPDMADELLRIVAQLEADDAVRCVIVAGAGAHFMAGGDIHYFAELLPLPREQRDAGLDRLVTGAGEVVSRLRAMPKPVIAAVRGAVAGFGFSLMCACDLVLASETTTCKLAYCQLGASPDGGGSHTLPRLLGVRRAIEVAMLDERIDAQRALELGLVTRVLADGELDGAAIELAQCLARQATGALGRTKRLMYGALDNTLAQQLEAERLGFLAGADSHDFAEAVTAFLARRKPQFSGQ